MSEILLVEDSQTQREWLCELLRKSGIKVTSAKDGVEALEHIQRVNPDLVVLDIVMPQMNGYEVCRRLKSDPKTQNVPVVICSSKGEGRNWSVERKAEREGKQLTPDMRRKLEEGRER